MNKLVCSSFNILLDTLRNRAEKNANDILFSKLEHNEITATPLVFDSTEFESLQAFGIAMFKASDMYMNNGDVILEFDIVDANKSYKTFDDVKKEIEEILNI